MNEIRIREIALELNLIGFQRTRVNDEAVNLRDRERKLLSELIDITVKLPSEGLQRI